jgi:ankyrin repeat protein
MSALNVAASSNDVVALQHLLREGRPIDLIDPGLGKTPLHSAVEAAAHAAAGLLLAMGASTWIADRERCPPLFRAVVNASMPATADPKHSEMVRLLIRYGAPINRGNTVRGLNLLYGQGPGFLLMIEAGYTPLQAALFYHSKEMVHLLVQHSASVRKKNFMGADAWQVSRETDTEALLRSAMKMYQ